MLLMIGFGTYYGGFQLPMSMSYYSPPAAIYMRDSAENVIVCGEATYLNNTPVEGVSVRLFATDELVSDILTTDVNGVFRSNIQFSAGQILTIYFEKYDSRFSVFIPYDAVDVFDLGTFVIEM